MLTKQTLYNTPNGQMIEKLGFAQVGVGNPNGYPVPGETGLWKLISTSNPSRDIDPLITPSVDTEDEYVRNPTTGNYDTVAVPTSIDIDPSYFDYYNLPLKAGWSPV